MLTDKFSYKGDMGTEHQGKEECTKTKINPNSIKKPQIQILAHQENIGMLDNKKTNIAGK